MNNFLWALKFLTIIPFDREDRIKPKGHFPVVYWFPVVGLCIGIFLSIAYLPLYFFFPPLLTDAFIILVYIAITGALHLDGLADTCDGIWGGWNKEKRLEIMRDSRIGSFGAMGLIGLLGLKYLSLLYTGEINAISTSPLSVVVKYVSSSISFENTLIPLTPPFFTGDSGGFLFPLTSSPTIVLPFLLNKCAALIIMPVVGRWAQVCAGGLSLYARSGSGTGSFVLEGTKLKHVIYTSIFPMFLFWFFYNLKGFAIFAIIIIFTLTWIWYMKKKIGGMTGDTLGATNEIVELVFLLSLLLLYRNNE